MSNNTTHAPSSRPSPVWKRIPSLAFLTLAASVVFYFYVLLPTPVALRWWHPARSAVMRERVAEAKAAGGELELRHTWVGVDRISRNLQRAVVAAEDGHFWEHEGVDWAAIGEELRYRGDGEFAWTDPRDREALADALGYLRANRSDVKGRSTLTQQLTKNLYFSSDRSLLRKLEELVVARRMERFVSKRRILELYLNFAEFGPGLFGAEAASKTYFGVSASDLSLVQAASLAATLPHPLTSNPAHRPGRMAWRRDRILALLRAGAGAPDAPPQPSVPVPEPEELAPTGAAGDGLAGEPLDEAPGAQDSTPADGTGPDEPPAPPPPEGGDSSGTGPR